MTHTHTTTLDDPKGAGWTEVRLPWKVGDCVALVPGGEPMTIVHVAGDHATAAWHNGGELREASFPVTSLRRSHGKLVLLENAEEDHDRAVELAEAGATKVTINNGALGWALLAFVAGMAFAVARGMV